jgi:hypothetical protein
MVRRNYYLTLGIRPNESATGIRRAFREIAKRYHPDRVGPERLGFFQELLEAYHVLADPERRRRYDQGLLRAQPAVDPTPQPVFDDAEDRRSLPQTLRVLRIVPVNDAPFDAALALVSGSLTAGTAAPKDTCEPLSAVVVLAPAEAARGGIVLLAVPSCSPCQRCGGSGREGMFPCGLCDGEGLLEEEELVRVAVPPGVGDGTLVEAPLRGLGIHSFYLRAHIRVGSDSERANREQPKNSGAGAGLKPGPALTGGVLWQRQ